MDRTSVALAAALLAASAPLSAAAQSWPAKTIRVIAPFPPGGGATDIVIRMTTPKMSAALGQSVVIDNRPGANGIIGSEIVAKSAPDGYTLLFASSSNLATIKFLNRNVPFDPEKDFTPISLMATPITGFVVHPSVPVNSIRELIDYARKNPGKLTYGSSGIGSMHHLTMEAFKRITGTELLHVPYKGAAPAVNAIMSGQIHVYFPGTSSIRPMLPAGKVKLLALLEPERYPGLPDVPTVAETIPGFTKAPSWFGLLGPAGLPSAIVSRLHAEVVKGMNQPDVRKRLEEVDIQILATTPEEFARVLRADIERSAELTRTLGIRAE